MNDNLRNQAFQKLPCWKSGILEIQVIGNNSHKRNRKLSGEHLLTEQDDRICLITKKQKISGKENIYIPQYKYVFIGENYNVLAKRSYC